MSTNVKLVYGARFICRAGGIPDVILRNHVVRVTEKQAAYLLTLQEKDRSNNVHKKFVVTDEIPTSENFTQMDERKRLAMEALAESKDLAEAAAEEEPTPKKRRAPRKPRAKKEVAPKEESTE